MYEQLDKLKREFKEQMIEYLLGLIISPIAIAFFFYWDNWFMRFLGYSWCLGVVFVVVAMFATTIDYYLAKKAVLKMYK